MNKIKLYKQKHCYFCYWVNKYKFYINFINLIL